MIDEPRRLTLRELAAKHGLDLDRYGDNQEEIDILAGGQPATARGEFPMFRCAIPTHRECQ